MRSARRVDARCLRPWRDGSPRASGASSHRSAQQPARSARSQATASYADRDGGSVTAEAACRPGDLDTVASKLEARSGQRCSSWRSAAVSASIAMSLTRAEESRCASGELVATLTYVAGLRASLGLECRRRWGVRAEVERLDLEQVALRATHGQLGHRETVRGRRLRDHVMSMPQASGQRTPFAGRGSGGEVAALSYPNSSSSLSMTALAAAARAPPSSVSRTPWSMCSAAPRSASWAKIPCTSRSTCRRSAASSSW